MASGRFPHLEWARGPVTGLLLLAVAGCQTPAALQLLDQSAPTGQVNFTIHVPRKLSKPERQVQATGDESSALLVNQVDVSLNGPGFYQPLYPPGYSNGQMPVQSDSISATITNVPTGKNRFLKVVALNGAKKLNQIGGMIDVQPGPYNHVVVGLSTTPTEQVFEELSQQAPDAARTLSSQGLQYFFDTYVTKPVTDAGGQNTFLGINPYLVNADGVVSYLVANNFQIPQSFDPTSATGKTFVLQSGTVHVVTGALPVGSRIWLNDPTSTVLVTTDPTTTAYDLTNVAPNFPSDPATPAAWTLTVLTPDGRVKNIDVAVARETLAQPTMAPIDIDLTSALQASSAQIQKIFLSPDSATWQGSSLTLNGRVVQQLFVYARDQQGNVISLLPDALTWTSRDARVQVGNGTALSDPGTALDGINLKDYGLVYPLAETSATDPTDVATVQGTLKGTSLTATMPFHIGYLGNAGSTAKINVTADDLHILEGDQTLTSMTQSLPLTAVEPEAPAGTTYRWVSSAPAIDVGAGTGGAIAIKAVGDLGSTTATITLYSSTGRQTSVHVTTALGHGSATASATAPSNTATFQPLPGANPGNTALTVNAGYPLGGYLNVLNGQASVTVSDPNAPTAGYYFQSSDPFTIAVSGHFPSASATLTALKPGTVTLTAMDAEGHLTTAQVRSNFDHFGSATVSVSAPVNPISLVGATPTTIQNALNTVFASGTYQATESNVASPAFNWLSLDPSRLVINPPNGQTFPNASATFTALRPGNVSFQLVSARTGETQTYTLNLNFANGSAAVTASAPGLVVRTLAGTQVTSATSQTLGELLSFQVSDPRDATPTFLWTSDTPSAVAVASQSGNQVQLRALAYGTTTIRVYNTHDGSAATLPVNVLTNGSGNGMINVTL